MLKEKPYLERAKFKKGRKYVGKNNKKTRYWRKEKGRMS